ncbi:MAG: hypothetical protein RL376_1860 [Verrucomicrobiota bacterium]|jgi:hypothetical protein
MTKLPRFVTLILAAAFLAPFSTYASLNFYFNSNPGGTGSGGSGLSMTGLIYGLSDNATSIPTSVDLYTINGVTVNTTFANIGGAFQSFTVSNGSITAANYNLTRFGSPIPGTIYEMQNLKFGYSGQNGANFFVPMEGDSSQNLSYTNNSGFGAIAYTSAIPEPANYGALLGAGTLGMLLFARRKRAA